ncbi:MAG: tRNA lysidine(34) synthetase TilS [Candidatus Polarisedimenticolia bacterium]
MNDRIEHRVESAFCDAVRRHALIVPGERVLAAVSGGADSVALLRLLHAHREALGLDLVVGHVNHAMRGATADVDEHFVKELASRLGLPCVARRAHPAPRTEEEARRVRHLLLKLIARDAGCVRIALAHTMDDQAETMLMRVARGAGRRGLSGMARSGPGPLVRPLLGVRREDLRRYLAHLEQTFHEDETNQDQSRLRNKVRARLLPVMEEMNRAVVPALARAAELLAQEDRWLDRQATDWVAAHTVGPSPDAAGGAVEVKAADLGLLDPALARRVARILLERAGSDPRGLPAASVERLLELARRPTLQSFHLDLPGGMKAERHGLSLVVHRAGSRPLPADAPLTARLSVPGRTDLPGLGLSLVARIAARADADPADRADPADAGAWRALVDADRLGTDVEVRTRLAGDRFHALGAPGEKKLGAFLIDRKIPRSGRDRLALVVGPEGIAWIVGVAVGHRYRVTEASTRVAILEARGLNGAEVDLPGRDV